ncbi:hypothetical protein N665_0089s0068 [Sinapis alba]|nr:hypothetical protein N665_0089s0068 [Sinapis alba]
MSNEENKSSSSSRPAKRPYTMINNSPGPKIYTASRADYKLLVLSLTCSFRRSSAQTSLRVPTQAQISNPKPIRLNDASIPPGSSRQTSLPLPTRPYVGTPRSMGLYDAPNRYPTPQWSSRALPYPFPPAPVSPSTSAPGTSNVQASSPQPSLPSPPLPSSVPTMLPTSPSSLWLPPPVPLVSARLPECPPSLPPAPVPPPSPPQEQGVMAPPFDDTENFLNVDYDDIFAACSPLPYVTGTRDWEQQWEDVPPPVLTNQPSGNLNVSVPQNGLTEPPLEHGSNSLSENVAPQVHASPPSTDLLNGPNNQQEGIAPPVHATLPSENSSTWSSNGLGSSNVPAPVAPSGPDHSNDQQWGPSESQLGTVPENIPFEELWNYPSSEEMQRCLAEVGFGTEPSWNLDSNSYPGTLLPSTNNPSSSSAPADLPPGNLQG